MAFESIDFVIDAKTAAAERGTKRVTAALRAMGNAAERAGKKAPAAALTMGQKFQALGPKMATAGKKMTMFLTLPILAVGTASVKMASDAAESFSKFETVFGSASGEMDAFITQLQKSVPATRTQLRDMTSTLQDLLVPIGIIPEEAIRMNRSFIQLAADLASFNNIPITQVLENLKSGIVGQSEPLQKFGIDVRAAAVETKAFELGLISHKGTVDIATRAQAVLAIAIEQSTFAIGDAARTAKETANQFKFFSRNVKELAESLGTTLLPKVNSAVSTINNWLEALRNTDSATFSLVATTGLVVAALGPLLLIAGKITVAIGALAASGAALTAGFIVLGSAAAVVAVAIGAWKFGRWLSGITGLDKAIQRFSGSEKRASQEADEFKKSVLSLNTHLRSQGIAVDRNERSWNDWFQALEEAKKTAVAATKAFGKTEGAIVELSEEIKEFIRASKQSLDPSQKLIKKITALETSSFSTKAITLGSLLVQEVLP